MLFRPDLGPKPETSNRDSLGCTLIGHRLQLMGSCCYAANLAVSSVSLSGVYGKAVASNMVSKALPTGKSGLSNKGSETS